MSKQKEALKLAREALEYISSHYMSLPKIGCMALAAVEEALAEQPAQEPVAIHQFRSPHCSDWYDGVPDHHDGHGPYEVRILYTSTPASKPWVGLTDVEWMNIVNKDHAWFGQRPEDVAHEVAKLVEAKLKEKNNG